jgi:hypothetical protein
VNSVPSGAAGAGGSASSTLAVSDGSASSLSVGASASGGQGGWTDDGTVGNGGSATASASASSTAASSVAASASAQGGNSGYNNSSYPGAGGNASATASVSANGGYGVATAGATGGYGATAGTATAQASVSNASSGYAQASSTAQGPSGEVQTYAYAPVGGPASAMTISTIGSGTPTLIPIVAGQSVSDATLTPGGPTVGVGGMSIGYGGGGETLQYQTYAYFNFTLSGPETIWLTLLSNMASNDGTGFDSLTFNITSSVEDYSYTFNSLSSAETFFTSNPLDLGNTLGGSEYVYLYEYLTLSDPPSFPGFSLDYALGTTPYVPSGVPEASTWAMMLTGFAGLGFAAFRRGQRAKASFAA